MCASRYSCGRSPFTRLQWPHSSCRFSMWSPRRASGGRCGPPRSGGTRSACRNRRTAPPVGRRGRACSAGRGWARRCPFGAGCPCASSRTPCETAPPCRAAVGSRARPPWGTGVVAAVDLEQHPLAGHPLTADTVLRWPAAAGTRDATPRQDAADGPTTQVQALVLPEQHCQLGVVRSRVAGGSEAHHGRCDIVPDGVVRTAPAVAVLQRRRAARGSRRGAATYVAH